MYLVWSFISYKRIVNFASSQKLLTSKEQLGYVPSFLMLVTSNFKVYSHNQNNDDTSYYFMYVGSVCTRNTYILINMRGEHILRLTVVCILLRFKRYVYFEILQLVACSSRGKTESSNKGLQHSWASKLWFCFLPWVSQLQKDLVHSSQIQFLDNKKCMSSFVW